VWKWVVVGLITAVVVAAGWYVAAGRDAKAAARDVPTKGPLVAAELAPKSLDEVKWFLVGNTLLRPDDYPDISEMLCRALHEPCAYIHFRKDPLITLEPPVSSPFFVGLRDGSVLLADHFRLPRDLNGRLLQLRGLDLDGNECEIFVTPNADLRLGFAAWQVLAKQEFRRVVDEGATYYEREWRPAASVTQSERALIEGALRRAPRVFPDQTYENEGQPGSRYDERQACRVELEEAVPVMLIPTDKWDPYYHLKRTDGRVDPQWESVPGRIQAYKVKPVMRYVDQAVVGPSDFLHGKAADVRLRLKDTKQWLYVTVLYEDPK
jgi:hypothetical protein